MLFCTFHSRVAWKTEKLFNQNFLIKRIKPATKLSWNTSATVMRNSVRCFFSFHPSSCYAFFFISVPYFDGSIDRIFYRYRPQVTTILRPMPERFISSRASSALYDFLIHQRLRLSALRIGRVENVPSLKSFLFERVCRPCSWPETMLGL